MSDLELLFLVLAIIYGLECAVWVPRGSVAFRTWLGRRWRPRHPGTLLGNARAGLVLAPPLPPSGILLIGSQPPLSLAPEGVLAFVASSVNPGWRPPQSARFVRFEELKAVEAAGKKVRINGAVFLRAPSAGAASSLAQDLGQLAQLPLAERKSAIQKFYRRSLDLTELERRWRDFQAQARTVRYLATGVFAYLFVLAPVLCWRLGLEQCWLQLLLGLLICTLLTAISFHRVHKRFYPKAEDDRFTHSLVILLSPATSARAYDVLARPLLDTFHPLALVKVLCAESDFRALARQVLIEIHHPGLPLCPQADPAAQATERQARSFLQTAVEEFLRKSGVEPGELLRADAPADATCRSYCPRCRAQFTTIEGTCFDCGGLALLPFPADLKRLKVSDTVHE